MDEESLERNIESLCRVCLQELPEKSIDFYCVLEGYENVTYSDAFTKVTGHVILAHEPQLLCMSCGDLVGFAHELKEKAEKAQQFLDEMLPKIDVALIKVEPDVREVDSNEDAADSESDFDYKPMEHDSDPDFELEEKPFKCHVCEKVYKTQPALNTHLKTSHPEEQPFECPYCKKRYLIERKLDAHQRNCSKRPKIPGEHKSKQKFVCPICGILASTDHIKNHSSKTGEKPTTHPQNYICDLCGVTTSSRASIANHMRYQHLNIQAKCKHCHGSFKNPSALARHIRRTHAEKTRAYRCRLCDFSSLREADLRRHRFSHTGKKLHKCQVCGAEFTTNCKLQIHLASHSDARPFTCEICGSAFKTKKGLGTHKKTHNPYDYECPVCGRSYLTNQLMRSHAEKNHPEYQLPPPGTVFSKSWRMKMAEQQMREMAMSKGIKTEELAVQELPPVQYYQPFCRS